MIVLSNVRLLLRWWADKKRIPAQLKGMRDGCIAGAEALEWAQRRIDELLEANNRYLQRARTAEAALAGRVGGPAAFMAADHMRAITVEELQSIPEDNGRRANCAALYPIKLYRI